MSVKIKRERADQRRHHRVTAPLYLEISGQKLRASDWSLSGVKIDDFDGELPQLGAELELSITLPFQGFNVSFEAKGEVVRVSSNDHTFALQYTEVGEREQELMQHFIEELVRGSMTDVEDTIQRIDVPVTPASLTPDTAKIDQVVPVRRWPIKTMVMSTFYLLFGTFVIGYAFVLAYTNFFRLEIQTAVISAPIETIEAPVDGHVNWSEYKAGQDVGEGDVVIRLTDGALERDIRLADIAILERRARLKFLKQKYASEKDRLESYATVQNKNVEQTSAELSALKQRLSIAKANVQRLQQLYGKGYTTVMRLDVARDDVIQLENEIANRAIELKSRVALAKKNLGKHLFNGREIVGNAPSLKAEIEFAEREIDLATKRKEPLLIQREELVVRAPFDGTLRKLPRPDNGRVARGDVIAVIEQRRNRNVTAYLNQDEVMSVGIGDVVNIFIPALGETQGGRVINIDRTAGFVREQQRQQLPGYRWRGPTDRSALVEIAFERPDLVADYDRYRSGLPVVAIFERRERNDVLHKLTSWVSIEDVERLFSSIGQVIADTVEKARSSYLADQRNARL